MEKEIMAPLFTVVGVIATAFITWFIAQKQILARHITKERAKWRDQIRKKALEAHNAILEGNEAKIRRLKHEFRVRLNPKDCCDNRILDCMKVKCTLKCRKKKAEEFSKQVSLLLKHDWERAKLEVGFHPIAWLTKMEPRRSCGGNSVDCMGDRLPCGKTFKRWYKRYKLNLCNSRVLFFFFPILVGVVTYYSGDIWSFLRSLCSGCT